MYNPDSGLKVYRNIPATVVSCYAERGYDVVVHYLRFTREDAEVLAEFAAMVDHVLISGGDGTVNYVVNMIVGDGYDLPVGILPSGTANDFARAIGMPAYISRACYRILDGTPHPIDVGRAGDICFVNVFSMGLYTDTSHKVPTRAKNMFGGLAYYAMGVAETLEFRKMRLKVTAENLDYEGEVLMLFVLNGQTAGGLKLGRAASVDDGLLDVIMVKSKNFFEMADAGFSLLTNLRTFQSTKDVTYLHCRSLTVESAEPETTDVDGQPGPSLPLNIECLEGALKVLF